MSNNPLTARLSRSWGMNMLNPFMSWWSNPKSNFLNNIFEANPVQKAWSPFGVPDRKEAKPQVYRRQPINNLQRPEQPSQLSEKILHPIQEEQPLLTQHIPQRQPELARPPPPQRQPEIARPPPPQRQPTRERPAPQRQQIPEREIPVLPVFQPQHSIPEEHHISPIPLPQEGQIHDHCEAVQYRKPLVCPDRAGYFRVGDSCYYVDNGRKMNVMDSKRFCNRLNDASGQSLGDWNLLAINDEYELEALGPAIAIMTERRKIPGPLWVEQIMLVETTEDAVALGTPYLFVANCTGPASVLNEGPIEDTTWIDRVLSSEASCNILTWLDQHENEEEEDPCKETKLNAVCELALDGDPSNFSFASDLPATSGFRARSVSNAFVKKGKNFNYITIPRE